MKRTWLRDDDGTYYRNCPLIMQEQRRPLNMILPWRARALEREWARAWGDVIRADTVGRHDRVATPKPFREAYPDHPGLWRLDSS